MTKVTTGAPLNLTVSDDDPTNRPRDAYDANWAIINAIVQALQLIDTTEAGYRASGDASTLTAAQLYVDGLIQSRSVKDPVRAVATSNLTLSGLQTVDGVALAAGDRVLVAGQTSAVQNGWYAAASGTWTRTTDADTSSEVKPGSICWVTEGTANADSLWELTTDGPIVLGTTALTFAAKGGNAAGFALASMVRPLFNDIATPKTASYSAALWDSATFDTTAGAITQALPGAPVRDSEVEFFSTYNATTNVLTVTGTGGPFTIYPGHGVTFRWNGAAWIERQDRKTKASLDREYSIANPTLSVSYNPDLTVASTTENGIVTAYTWNTDGTVATETRGGVTRTFAYSNGLLVGAS